MKQSSIHRFRRVAQIRMKYVILYMGSLALGGAGAWAISRWGPFLGVLDRSNHRSSHDGVVTKGGGVGILAAFLFCSTVLHLPKTFWVPTGLLAIFSFWGDRSEVSPKIRLIVQFIATVVVLGGVFWGPQGSMRAYLLIIPMAFFVVATANYYNFMDGIDGIAGITGIVAFGLIVLFGDFSGANEAFLILAGCMGFACLGFLPFNMPRARVFMGDVGSVLLGFVYAGLAVGLSHSLNDFLVLCSFLFPFYADELTTEFVRLRDGENLLKPHRRHVYQLLANEMGIDHWKVSVGYGVLQAVVGVGALMLRGVGTVAVLGYLGVWFVGFWVFGSWVRKRTETRKGYSRKKAQKAQE